MSKFHKGLIVSIFLLAFLVRTAVLIGVRLEDGKINLEPWEQETMALNILNGKGFVYDELGTEYRSYCEPLYVYFIAAIYRLFDVNHFILGMLQVLLSSMTCLLVYVCGERLFDKKVGLFAMLLTAVHPGLILYVTKIHPLNLDVFFVMATLVVFLRFFDSGPITAREIFLAGIVAGLTLLTRPTAAPFIIFALLSLFFKRRIGLGKFVILLLSIGLIGSVWAARNYAVHKKLIFTRSGTGKVFWIGNNPLASGSAMQPSGISVFDSAPSDFKRGILEKDELQQNRLFREAAIDFIRHHPLRFLVLFCKKIYFFFWFSPQAGLLYSRMVLLIYKLFYIPAVLFASYGLYAIYKTGEIFEAKFIIALFLVVSVAVLQSIFYVEGRHRWLIEPVILVFSSFGFLNFINRYGK